MVGGAVRDELLGHESKDADFLVPGVDIEGLRAALEPHGRTEELVVAGQPVGVRFYPRDPDLRRRVRAGIEVALVKELIEQRRDDLLLNAISMNFPRTGTCEDADASGRGSERQMHGK